MTKSKGNEGVLDTFQSSKTEALPSDGLVSYPRQSIGEGLLLCRPTVGNILQPLQTGLQSVAPQYFCQRSKCSISTHVNLTQ